jgi:hypothetical protein
MEAGKVMEAWAKLCVEESGMSNVFKAGGAWYMAEISRREHADGAITGSISRFEGDPRGAASCMARRAGTFRIEGNGEVKRGPALLKKAGALMAAFRDGAMFVVT